MDTLVGRLHVRCVVGPCRDREFECGMSTTPRDDATRSNREKEEPSLVHFLYGGTQAKKATTLGVGVLGWRMYFALGPWAWLGLETGVAWPSGTLGLSACILPPTSLSSRHLCATGSPTTFDMECRRRRLRTLGKEKPRQDTRPEELRAEAQSIPTLLLLFLFLGSPFMLFWSLYGATIYL